MSADELRNGPNEFTITGPLKHFNIIKDLHKITAETLLTNGRWDEAQDNILMPFFVHIPKVKWVQFADSSHTAHLEETERYLMVVGTFLTEA